MRLPLKRMMRTAHRPQEEPTGLPPCETCEATVGHESWCPERMHAWLDEWRAQQKEEK